MFIQAQQGRRLFLPARAGWAAGSGRGCPARGLWGQTPAAQRSSALPMSAPCFVCAQISFMSLRATAHQHKTSAENSPRSPAQSFLPSRVELMVPYLLLVLYRWLNDLQQSAFWTHFRHFRPTWIDARTGFLPAALIILLSVDRRDLDHSVAIKKSLQRLLDRGDTLPEGERMRGKVACGEEDRGN